MQMDTAGFRVALLALEGSWPRRSPKDTPGLVSRYWPLEKKKKKAQHLKKRPGRYVLGSKQGQQDVVCGQVTPSWFLPGSQLWGARGVQHRRKEGGSRPLAPPVGRAPSHPRDR